MKSKSKKILILILALALIGSSAVFMSNNDLLQGELKLAEKIEEEKKSYDSEGESETHVIPWSMIFGVHGTVPVDDAVFYENLQFRFFPQYRDVLEDVTKERVFLISDGFEICIQNIHAKDENVCLPAKKYWMGYHTLTKNDWKTIDQEFNKFIKVDSNFEAIEGTYHLQATLKTKKNKKTNKKTKTVILRTPSYDLRLLKPL